MAKRPKRIGDAKSALHQLNFWLVTLGVVIAGYMAGEGLLWWQGRL